MSDSRLPPGTPHLQAEICPYLGIEEDSQTCLGYPSLWNGCHRARPMVVVRLSHQRRTCLSSRHTGCPVFCGEKDLPFPADLRASSKAPK